MTDADPQQHRARADSREFLDNGGLRFCMVWKRRVPQHGVQGLGRGRGLCISFEQEIHKHIQDRRSAASEGGDLRSLFRATLGERETGPQLQEDKLRLGEGTGRGAEVEAAGRRGSSRERGRGGGRGGGVSLWIQIRRCSLYKITLSRKACGN